MPSSLAPGLASSDDASESWASVSRVSWTVGDRHESGIGRSGSFTSSMCPTTRSSVWPTHARGTERRATVRRGQPRTSARTWCRPRHPEARWTSHGRDTPLRTSRAARSTCRGSADAGSALWAASSIARLRTDRRGRIPPTLMGHPRRGDEGAIVSEPIKRNSKKRCRHRRRVRRPFHDQT